MVLLHTAWYHISQPGTASHILVPLHTSWYHIHSLVHQSLVPLHTAWYHFIQPGTTSHNLVPLHTSWYHFIHPGTTYTSWYHIHSLVLLHTVWYITHPGTTTTWYRSLQLGTGTIDSWSSFPCHIKWKTSQQIAWHHRITVIITPSHQACGYTILASNDATDSFQLNCILRHLRLCKIIVKSPD